MKIAIASDHAGFGHKHGLIEHLRAGGHEVRDFGTDTDYTVDYPDYIRPAAEAVAAGVADAAVMLGGSGNGEAIVANKVPGIRCAVCWNEETGRLAREHNDANAISIGRRMTSLKEAKAIVDAWLGATFKGGRHLRRVAKIEGGGLRPR